MLFVNNVRLVHGSRERATPRSDIGAAEAFKTIVCRSTRAKELVTKGLLKTETWYEASLTEAGKIDQRLHEHGGRSRTDVR